jgi:hypothetical protein
MTTFLDSQPQQLNQLGHDSIALYKGIQTSSNKLLNFTSYLISQPSSTANFRRPPAGQFTIFRSLASLNLLQKPPSSNGPRHNFHLPNNFLELSYPQHHSRQQHINARITYSYWIPTHISSSLLPFDLAIYPINTQRPASSSPSVSLFCIQLPSTHQQPRLCVEQPLFQHLPRSRTSASLILSPKDRP